MVGRYMNDKYAYLPNKKRKWKKPRTNYKINHG